jgi:murein endopeptidase
MYVILGFVNKFFREREMPKIYYTPEGEKITEHDHQWTQYAVSLITGATSDKAVTGCNVMWRCTRKGCNDWREDKKLFRKPSKNAQGNSYSPKFLNQLKSIF